MDARKDNYPDPTFGHPSDMDARELGLALYHIGANTKLSETFTVKFINEVVLRASQVLSSVFMGVDLSDGTDSTVKLSTDCVREWLTGHDNVAFGLSWWEDYSTGDPSELEKDWEEQYQIQQGEDIKNYFKTSTDDMNYRRSMCMNEHLFGTFKPEE